MKKKLNFIFILIIGLAMFNCQTDDTNKKSTSTSKLSRTTISKPELLDELSDNNLKKIISNNLSQQLTKKNQNSTQNLELFNKIINGNEYTTYSLLLNEFTDNTPYLNYFVIEKRENIEKAGYIKYTPSLPIPIIDKANFSGTIQVFDVDNKLYAETSFTNGQPNTSKNKFSTFNDCVNQISIIAYPCSHTNNHPPNVPCAEGFINDGYWEITITTYCNPSSTINAIAPPNNVMDYSSGGGGLSYNNFHLALQLSSEQLGWLDANQWFKYVLFKPYYQLTQDWEVYGIRNEYIAKLEYLMNHTETCQEITNYLEENNYVESAQEFAVELMDTSIQLEINIIDIWLNEFENFRNQMSNTERAIFDSILPNRQMWYMASAYKALKKSSELFPDTFIPSNSHNGKGDAFRHALWNAYFTGFCGATLAEQLTTAHEENVDPDNPFPQKEIDMDLFNNQKGRLIASYSNITNVTQNVLDYFNSGGLRYLNVLNPNSPYYPTFYSTLIPTNQ